MSLVFAINGQRFDLDLSTVDPSTTLLEFIRYQTSFKSVKLSCGEGGCGACVVLLSKYDPVLHHVEDFTVSSCLTLLCSINHCNVTTSEGIGNSRDGFHSVHKRFAGFHASQCGFCTPGMSVSLFSALLDADKSKSSELTLVEAEKAVSGNLCRCTGYRPIVDACKSFASDVDIEDLGFNSFCKKGSSKEEMLMSLPRSDKPICTFPEFLKEEIKSTDSGNFRWCSPGSVEELQGLLGACKANSNRVSVKLVAGNTSNGYYKEEREKNYDKYIDLTQIQELNEIREKHNGLEIGGAVTISKVICALKEIRVSSETAKMFGKLATHMEKIAARFIRNFGSVAGNLVMAQRKQFPSDMATILLAAAAFVNIMNSPRGPEKLTLEEFLRRHPLEAHELVLSIEIPFSHSETNSELLFETFRAAPRPTGSALAYLNAAFLAEVKDTTVINCRLAFGAYGTKHAIRCKEVEEFLSGKVITDNVLNEAITLLGKTIVPEDGTRNLAYRSSLARGFLFEFLHTLLTRTTEPSNGYYLNPPKRLPMLSSSQHVPINDDYTPVGEPVTKSGSSLQASGEAVFVDDIPSPSNCLYGAFIYSKKPFARIKGIHFKEKSVPDGVHAVISCKDVPKGAQNVGLKTPFGTDPLFAEDVSICVGQCIALVVADTQRHADAAANLAVVEYETEGLEPPILSIEDAVKRSSFFKLLPFAYPKQVGDTSKGMAEADHRILSSEVRLGSQYYFYMETQTALALPDEDNTTVVHSSTQLPQCVQSTIAACLGIPENNVRVITRRVGGGFGGKAVKSVAVATACAVAANKLRRPVRTYVNRKTDMIMTGGRHPMKITYNVGFKSTGKITALDLELLMDAGSTLGYSMFVPSNIIGSLKKYNWGALSFDIKLCKTNLPSRAIMRAPGDVQGTYIAEAIIENVASSLSLDVDVKPLQVYVRKKRYVPHKKQNMRVIQEMQTMQLSGTNDDKEREDNFEITQDHALATNPGSLSVDTVRKINLHTYESLALFYNDGAGETHEYTLSSMWDKIGISSNFEKQVSIIRDFNKSNKWKKRGISRVPIIYQVAMFATPGRVSILSDGTIVVEVGGIEIGQGLWTKVKQMTAYALGLLQCEGTKELFDKIRVVQSDTLSMVQGGYTGGSTTSEGSCAAVRLCCETLVKRLKPLMEQSDSPVSWNKLISQAYAQSVNLSASDLYTPGKTPTRYLNYGVAVSEVEVNLVTGHTTVLQTDILYDCGKSLNPAVDLGQIEGSFVQGLGFFMLEEYITDTEGLLLTDSTWTYKIPTVDTIPRQFNVEILNSGHHEKRVLSSKASGEPPLLLAASVHCALRDAVKEARKQLYMWKGEDGSSASMFQLPVPATMPVVKELCGLDIVETYLQWKLGTNSKI